MHIDIVWLDKKHPPAAYMGITRIIFFVFGQPKQISLEGVFVELNEA